MNGWICGWYQSCVKHGCDLYQLFHEEQLRNRALESGDLDLSPTLPISGCITLGISLDLSKP